jgi:type VI secretion system protein ImpA
MCYEPALSSAAEGIRVADFTDVIEIPGLLTPIEGDPPQGRDTRQEFDTASPYQRLRAARQDARDAERRALTADGDNPGPAPDWAAVAEAAIELIAHHSKDLEAAAWLIEALVRTGGLRGLGAGATVVTGLTETFWGTLYPAVAEDEPDEDPAELRLRALAGLVSGARAALLPPLRLLPLFQGPDGMPVTLADYDAAVSIERLDPEQRESRIAAGARGVSTLDDMARADPDSLAILRRDAAEALEAWNAMDTVLAEHAGSAKPSLADVRGLLERIDGLARRLAPAGEAVPDESTAEPGVAPIPRSGPTGPGPIATRDDALRRLDEVADWFRRNEPQSPLSYTLTEAVRRGRMSLPDLLADIISDYSTRAAILTALGIKPPPEDTE